MRHQFPLPLRQSVWFHGAEERLLALRIIRKGSKVIGITCIKQAMSKPIQHINQSLLVSLSSKKYFHWYMVATSTLRSISKLQRSAFTLIPVSNCSLLRF
jgi:hypothetical protein